MNTEVGLNESRQLLSQIDLQNAPYARLGLSGNPFFAGGLAPSNPQIEPWHEVRVQIIDFLKRFLTNRSSNGLMLLGGYGTGKTYTLNYIRSLLEGMSINVKVKVVTITDPGIHPYHVIRRILLALGEEEIGTMIWSIVGPYFRAQYEADGNYFENMARNAGRTRSALRDAQNALKFSLMNLSETAWSDHRLFLRALDRFEVVDRNKLVHQALPVLTNPNSATVITEIAGIAEDLVAICLFDGIPALERWKAMTEGVGQGAIKPGNEPQFLTALLKLLKYSGIEYFVLLLDEFEKVPQLERMTEKDARQHLDTIRMLIDESHEKLPFAYIVGSNHEAWALAVEKMAPLKDRFTTVELPTMANDEIAIYTISRYLSLVRLDPNEGTDSLKPFPDNFIRLIPLDARQTTRQLVKLCHSLVEEALKRGLESVTEQLVKELVGQPVSQDMEREDS